MHAVYQGALAKYKKDSGVKDAAVLAFVEKLLAFAEKAGPKVEIRFRRKVGKIRGDRRQPGQEEPIHGNPVVAPPILRRRSFTSCARPPSAKPSRPVSPARSPPMFCRSISAHPSPIPTHRSLRPTSRPCLSSTPPSSGASYLNANPRGVFVGSEWSSKRRSGVPDDTKPHKYKQTAWRPPDVTLSKGDAETWETAVYDAMAAKASPSSPRNT